MRLSLYIGYTDSIRHICLLYPNLAVWLRERCVAMDNNNRLPVHLEQEQQNHSGAHLMNKENTNY